MQTDIKQDYVCTTEEAMKLLRSQPIDTSFHIHVRVDARVQDLPNSIFPDGCAGAIKVSRKTMRDLLKGFLHPTLEEKGARIPIHINSYISIGKVHIHFWVG